MSDGFSELKWIYKLVLEMFVLPRRIVRPKTQVKIKCSFSSLTCARHHHVVENLVL